MQLAQHFNEFLCDGYRLSAEACEVRFPHVDSSRVINAGTVGLTDGFAKVLIMTGVCVSSFIVWKLGNFSFHTYLIFQPDLNLISL